MQSNRILRADEFTNKRHAVVFDIDGVLCDSTRSIAQYIEAALEQGREIFGLAWDDWKCDDLKPIEGWVQLLLMLHEGGYTVVVVTARSNVKESTTRKWLAAHRIPFDEIFFWDPEEYTYDEYKGQLVSTIQERFVIKLAIDDSTVHCNAYKDAGIPFLHAHREAVR